MLPCSCRICFYCLSLLCTCCMCIPGIVLHSGSSAVGSLGSSDPPGHLGESHRLQLFLSAGMEGTLAPQAPQGYLQYTLHPHLPTPFFISLPLTLSSSSIHFYNIYFLGQLYTYKTDIQHYVRAKAIFLLKWISTHLPTWRECWSHGFVMSLESLVCFSVIGVEVNRQAVCE